MDKYSFNDTFLNEILLVCYQQAACNALSK